ncbi:MAG: response regulator [Bacteroidales bacterium]|nr:response regulator [Bacteroidales bacterium]
MNTNNFKILVAEDEEINFLYIDILIKKEYPHLQIIHAKNGQEAVDFCKSDAQIKLVFMDIKMPVMNGYEATNLIKKLNNHLPIVALTAYSTDDDKKQAMQTGFIDFLTKPINKKKFLTIIKDNLPSSN